jgi:hypothetical protein
MEPQPWGEFIIGLVQFVIQVTVAAMTCALVGVVGFIAYAVVKQVARDDDTE